MKEEKEPKKKKVKEIVEETEVEVKVFKDTGLLSGLSTPKILPPISILADNLILTIKKIYIILKNTLTERICIQGDQNSRQIMIKIYTTNSLTHSHCQIYFQYETEPKIIEEPRQAIIYRYIIIGYFCLYFVYV